jgi:hypothetical protein
MEHSNLNKEDAAFLAVVVIVVAAFFYFILGISGAMSAIAVVLFFVAPFYILIENFKLFSRFSSVLEYFLQ